MMYDYMNLWVVFTVFVGDIVTFFSICKWNDVELSIPNIYDDETPLITLIFFMIFDLFNFLYAVFYLCIEQNKKCGFLLNLVLFAFFIGCADCMSKLIVYLCSSSHQKKLMEYWTQSFEKFTILITYIAMCLAMYMKYLFTGTEDFQTLSKKIFEIAAALIISWDLFLCGNIKSFFKWLKDTFINKKWRAINNQKKHMYIAILINGGVIFCMMLLVPY